MRDPYIADVLEPFVPASTEAGDWDDVLHRAGISQGRRRFRRALAIVLLALGIIVPVGVTQEWIFPFFPQPEDVVGEPVPTGPRVLLAEGEIGGQRWTYTAQMTDQGVCVDVAFAGNAGGGCGFGVRGEPGAENRPWPARHWVGTGTTLVPEEGAIFAGGPIARQVETVEIVLTNGGTVSADIVDGPEELRAPLDFYLAILPPTATIETVIAKDANGIVLERTPTS